MPEETLPNRNAMMPRSGVNYPSGDPEEKTYAERLHEVFVELNKHTIFSDEESARGDYEPLEGALFIPEDGGQWYRGDGSSWQSIAAEAVGALSLDGGSLTGSLTVGDDITTEGSIRQNTGRFSNSGAHVYAGAPIQGSTHSNAYGTLFRVSETTHFSHCWTEGDAGELNFAVKRFDEDDREEIETVLTRSYTIAESGEPQRLNFDFTLPPNEDGEIYLFERTNSLPLRRSTSPSNVSDTPFLEHLGGSTASGSTVNNGYYYFFDMGVSSASALRALATTPDGVRVRDDLAVTGETDTLGPMNSHDRLTLDNSDYLHHLRFTRSAGSGVWDMSPTTNSDGGLSVSRENEDGFGSESRLTWIYRDGEWILESGRPQDDNNRQFYHTGNLTPEAIGALSIDGGTISGQLDITGGLTVGGTVISESDLESGRDIEADRNIISHGGMVLVDGDNGTHLRLDERGAYPSSVQMLAGSDQFQMGVRGQGFFGISPGYIGNSRSQFADSNVFRVYDDRVLIRNALLRAMEDAEIYGDLDVGGNGLVEGDLDVDGTINADNAYVDNNTVWHSGNLTPASGGDLSAHEQDTSNPHNVTAAQVGALSIDGGTISGQLTISNSSLFSQLRIARSGAGTWDLGPINTDDGGFVLTRENQSGHGNESRLTWIKTDDDWRLTKGGSDGPRFYNEENLSAEDIDALPTSGGSLSGPVEFSPQNVTGGVETYKHKFNANPASSPAKILEITQEGTGNNNVQVIGSVNFSQSGSRHINFNVDILFGNSAEVDNVDVYSDKVTDNSSARIRVFSSGETVFIGVHNPGGHLGVLEASAYDRRNQASVEYFEGETQIDTSDKTEVSPNVPRTFTHDVRSEGDITTYGDLDVEGSTISGRYETENFGISDDDDLVIESSSGVEHIRQPEDEPTQLLQGAEIGQIEGPIDSLTQLINASATPDASAGDDVGYTFSLNSTTALEVSGEADGDGGIENVSFGFHSENGQVAEIDADGNLDIAGEIEEGVSF